MSHLRTDDATAPAKAGWNLLELCLPVVPEQAAAVALGTFRSMLRAPEVKMAWGTAFIGVRAAVAGVFLAQSGLAGWQSLEPFGRLLQRREIKILNTVTAEQE